jgi:hypothetical protein
MTAAKVVRGAMKETIGAVARCAVHREGKRGGLARDVPAMKVRPTRKSAARAGAWRRAATSLQDGKLRSEAPLPAGPVR